MKGLKDRLLESQMRVNSDFLAFCKDYAIRELKDMEGSSCLGCDLGFTLSEKDNKSNSVFMDSVKSKQALEEWSKDYGQWFIDTMDILGYKEKDYMIEDPETGELVLDIYTNPKQTATRFIINGVDQVVSQCPTVKEFWRDEIELNNINIYHICSEIKRVKKI